MPYLCGSVFRYRFIFRAPIVLKSAPEYPYLENNDNTLPWIDNFSSSSERTTATTVLPTNYDDEIGKEITVDNSCTRAYKTCLVSLSNKATFCSCSAAFQHVASRSLLIMNFTEIIQYHTLFKKLKLQTFLINFILVFYYIKMCT